MQRYENIFVGNILVFIVNLITLIKNSMFTMLRTASANQIYPPTSYSYTRVRVSAHVFGSTFKCHKGQRVDRTV